MTANRHGSSVVEYPSELVIVTTREFDAPLELVFEVFTRPEHVRNWFAPFKDEVTVCSIDLCVGGSYHIVFVTETGAECSFRGTYSEVEPPTRTVATWLFEGWPDAEAVETVDLREKDGVTTLTMTLAFRDQAGRDHMIKHDGQEDSLDKLEDYLTSLLAAEKGCRSRRLKSGHMSSVTFADVSRLTTQLDGISERRREGLLEWRRRGRLVARQLDDSHIVIRASFDFRDLLVRSFPETFSVPPRFVKHMMIVADLDNGNGDAIEDAVIAAWELQSRG